MGIQNYLSIRWLDTNVERSLSNGYGFLDCTKRLDVELLPRILKIRNNKIAALKKKVPHKIFLWCQKSVHNYCGTYWVYAHKDDVSSQTSSFLHTIFNAGGTHTLS